jgi:regulator of replication initiation timing
MYNKKLEIRLEEAIILIDKFTQENVKLKLQIESLTLENQAVKAEFVKLQERLAVNSRNSSLSPSKDRYKAKSLSCIS